MDVLVITLKARKGRLLPGDCLPDERGTEINWSKEDFAQLTASRANVPPAGPDRRRRRAATDPKPAGCQWMSSVIVGLTES